MEASNINTLDDADRFVEGCLNDLIHGISTKSEIMIQMARYTGRIAELALKKNADLLAKVSEQEKEIEKLIALNNKWTNREKMIMIAEDKQSDWLEGAVMRENAMLQEKVSEQSQRIQELTKENEDLKAENKLHRDFEKVAETEFIKELERRKDEECRKAVHIVNEHRHNDLIEKDKELSRLREERKDLVEALRERRERQIAFQKTINIPPGWIQKEIDFLQSLLSKFEPNT